MSEEYEKDEKTMQIFHLNANDKEEGAASNLVRNKDEK